MLDYLTTWRPHSLPHCLDSEVAAWVVTVLAVYVIIQYHRVAVWFDRACQLATRRAERLFLYQRLIFISCLIAGYLTVILAWFAPGLAVAVRIVFCLCTGVLCELLLFRSHGETMPEIMSQQQLGHDVVEASLEEMSDRDLADFVRKAASMHMNRIAKDARNGVGSGRT